MTDTLKNEDIERRLASIIDSILKPLRFASKDGFHHINSVKSIEPLMDKLCNDALSLGLFGKKADTFASLKKIFSGFDTAASDEKKSKVTKAMELIEGSSHEHHEDCESVAVSAEEALRMINALKTPIEFVKGVGPKLGERLRKKGLTTVEDLLFYLPLRHEDRRNIKRIKDLQPGMNEASTGEILVVGEVRYGKRKVFEMAVGDGSSIMRLKWFHYRLQYMKGRYSAGQKIFFYGPVTVFGSQKEIIHPDIEMLDDNEEAQKSEGIVPVYSQVDNLHQKTIRKIVKSAVDNYAGKALGGVPCEVVRRHGLLTLTEAVKEAHFPTSMDRPLLARKSLAFDELFLLELGLALKRRHTKKEAGIAFNPPGRLEDKLRKMLPYKLTAAQERVLGEIKKDMGAAHPMNRLIQGDVGSGKTIVSFLTALRAVEAGYQAAIMAPTEILAEQHYLNTRKFAEELGIRIELLTGSLTKSIRNKILQAVQAGEVDLLIGTHALIQKDVEFGKLGVAVVDEQHRFGVVQRAALRKKTGGPVPDILIMTATPIPRTLSMTIFGDLDVSIIDELPPGRKPVYTKIIREKERQKAYDVIRKELQSGSQCYIVYPLVEESEELSLKDATNMKEHLQKDVFTEFRVGLLHGRLKSAEKEAVMRDFKDRKLDILVATTVLEVGVDVPNASVIMIEHAERFGLAQLHQLRGRVGRGEKRSMCLLLAQWTQSDDTFKRLKVMEETSDGFRIAEEDLKIRGPGDFLGTRQSGMPDFRTSEALTDMTLLKKAREEAFRYLEKDPKLAGKGAGCLKEVLKARWEGRLEMAEIG